MRVVQVCKPVHVGRVGCCFWYGRKTNSRRKKVVKRTHSGHTQAVQGAPKGRTRGLSRHGGLRHAEEGTHPRPRPRERTTVQRNPTSAQNHHPAQGSHGWQPSRSACTPAGTRMCDTIQRIYQAQWRMHARNMPQPSGDEHARHCTVPEMHRG